MENKEIFFKRLEPHLAPSDLVRVRGAYYMAKHGHRAQVRQELDNNGEPLRYFEHCRRVALIAMDEFSCYDPDIICTALLHDTLEDTQDIDAAIIEQFFGKDVARRVRVLSKIPKEGYLERLLAADSLTRFVKLCDRLDNLRSLPDDEKFRTKTIKETKEYLSEFKSCTNCKLTSAAIKAVDRLVEIVALPEQNLNW